MLMIRGGVRKKSPSFSGLLGGFLITIFRVSFFFALLLVISCSSTQTKVPQPLTLPKAFSTSGEAPLPDQWWLSFNDSSLNRLIEQALAGNFNLRQVWDRLYQAEAVARAAGAPVLPSLEGRGGASHSAQRTDSGPGGWTMTYRSNLSLGLYASYELDLWGRVRSRRDAAELDVQASREQVQSAAITVSALVASTWYEFAEQTGQLELLKEQLKLNEDMLELVTLRFRHGLAGATDVLQQRQLIESRRGDIVAVELRRSILGHQLAILLGRKPTENVKEGPAALIQLPPLPDTGLPADLIQRRPDIRALHYQILAADRRVAVALADRFPRVSLSASADTSAGMASTLFNNWLATLGANLVQPLFDAGSRKAEVERTRAVVSERLNQYGQAVLTALGEVEDALIQERKQREFIESLQRQLDVSSQVIERTRESYMRGAMDYLRVLDALQRHQTLQRQSLLAKRQLIQYRINLCRALGGGWDLKRPELLAVTGRDVAAP